MLDEIGLHSALRSYVEGLTKRSGIDEAQRDRKPLSKFSHQISHRSHQA
jgi:hypothetical protein